MEKMVFREPETPREPMEFLSRSWSLSAMEVAKALCPPPGAHYNYNYCSPAKTISELDDDDHDDNNNTSNNNFSFRHLVLDRIMSSTPSSAQATADISSPSSGRLSNASGGGPFLNDSLSDTPPHSPPSELITTCPITQSNPWNTQCRISTASSSAAPGGGKTLGRWFKDRKEKKREEIRAQNALVHAAVSVAGVAAAVAAIATATAASPGSRKDEQGTKTDLAVASAAALVAAQCVEAAEIMGAEPEHLSSVVKSSVNVQSPGDIMTLTAAAATALRGAATLKARTMKDVWSIGSVIINPTSPPISSSTVTKVFDTGKHSTVLFNVQTPTCCNSSHLLPPKPLLIASPSESGDFPILLFLHGYLLSNSFYSNLITHIASHGFIVIAPQLYSVAGPDSTNEVKSAAGIIDWVSVGLDPALPTGVKPDLTKIAISGHSRGGKTAFALALGLVTIPSLRLSALLGIDPVDGMNKGKQTTPPVLTYVPRSFDLEMPVLVMGSGLGEVKRNSVFPACAPKGVNHENFYEECRGPGCYLVVKDYGHLDMLDDETKGVRGKATYCLCKNGECREPMRKGVGGVMVAFLKAYLRDDWGDLIAVKDGRRDSPVQFQNTHFFW